MPDPNAFAFFRGRPIGVASPSLAAGLYRGAFVGALAPGRAHVVDAWAGAGVGGSADVDQYVQPRIFAGALSAVPLASPSAFAAVLAMPLPRPDAFAGALSAVPLASPSAFAAVLAMPLPSPSRTPDDAP